MRIDWPVFLLSITLGLFLFAADMLVDRFFLYDRLITLPFVGETKANELAMRLLILAILAVFGGICGRLVYNLRDLKGQQSDTAKFLQQLIEAIPIPVFYKDEKNIYIGCNDRFAEFIKLPKDKIIGKGVYDVAPPHLADKYNEMDMALLNNPGVQTYEAEVIDSNEKVNTVLFHKATYQGTDGKVEGMIGLIFDVTELRTAEREREQVVAELQDALKQVKTLGEFLPICASCKKIRDDSGYWQRLETYLKKSSDIDFSHSICPDCSQKLMDEYEEEMNQENEENELKS